VRSAADFYLRFAPPAWVRRVRNGVGLILATLGAALAGGIVVWVVSMSLVIPRAMAGREPDAGHVLVMQLAQNVFGLLLSISAIVAVFLTTSPDPRRRDVPGPPARVVSRLAVCIAPLSVVTGMVWVLVVGGRTHPQLSAAGAVALTIAILIGMVTGVAATVLPLALLGHFAWLMRRVPQAGLVRFATVEFWCMLVVGVMVIGGYGLVILAMWPTFSAAFSAAASGQMPPTGQVTITAGPITYPIAGAAATAPALSPAATSQLAAIGNINSTGPTPGSIPVTASVPGASMPAVASAPASIPAIPPPSLTPGLFVGLGMASVGVCGVMSVGIAYVVLLFLVLRALKAAALAAAELERAVPATSGGRQTGPAS
jgi:hypothetical protein